MESGTKYPIILVHGVVIKDFKFFRAFGRIEDVLKEEGNKVYTAPIDGMGTIETNAIQLKEFIEQILKEEQVDKVNLIAHSKGSLDSKYFIENLNNIDAIASLTTLATPFKGSPIASFILKFPRWMLKIVAWWLNLIYKIFGDKHPDALKVCEQLQEVQNIDEECMHINKDIYCQSYSTTMSKKSDDFVMSIPMAFSKHFSDSETDALVPKESTKMGIYQGNAINESISHTEIVDFMVKKKKKEKIYSFYKMVAKDLKNKGF